MKYLPRVFFVVILLTSLNALANSVNYTNLNVTLGIQPNYGFGDNVGGILFGSNVNLNVFGGTATGWFDGGFPGEYLPGSGGGGDVTIYFDSGDGGLGGQNYGNISIGSANLYSPSFTFPTNDKDGQNFIVSEPATLGLVVVEGCTNAGVCTTYNLTSRPGRLVLSFTYYGGMFNPNSGYFTTVPEPGTLGLMAIGIGAFAWHRRKLVRASSF
jgi:PEP-CTERM motif-containing protein